ncbi:uncharacterized protein [Miscanthus floridulus]|uniref:uncharacterized protein isoform X2 n=1 Tax=Miscanthus floridulus TaxID=154761 RepID=UPI00345857C9
MFYVRSFVILTTDARGQTCARARGQGSRGQPARAQHLHLLRPCFAIAIASIRYPSPSSSSASSPCSVRHSEVCTFQVHILAPSSTASCSPPESSRYNLRSKRLKREIKMPPKRASWTEDETKLLLDLCLQEKEKCNFNQQGLATAGWCNIYTYFPRFDKKQCNNKLGYLKKAYLTWKEGLTTTGLGRDPHTGAIAADTEYWETQEVPQPMNSDGSQPEVLRGRQPRYLDQLEALFGDRNRNTGCFVSASGIRDSTPSAVPRRLDLGGPSSNHSGSKRDTRDHVVNSPEKKKNCKYIARLSETIAARSASRDRERTREQAEVDEAMQLLREDGVPATSDMFFLATDLFNNSVPRRVFRNLLTTEEWMAWLTYQMNKHQK